MQRRFFTLDVFTTQRYAGNPLAVVLDSGGLDGAAMQAVAREFNLSETVFVLPPDGPAHRARYRIFTPKEEVAFAGHPTIGTAVLLGMLDGGHDARDMVLEANIGAVPCRVTPSPGGGEASLVMPSLPQDAGPPPSSRELAGALGLDINDIGAGAFQPVCFATGVGFTFVPLVSLDAVRRAAPDLGRFAAMPSRPAHRAVYVYAGETAEPGHDFHARMFAPSYGIVEDPATGSAVAAFAAVLARFGGLADGAHAFAIEQGYEMGRPSAIRLDLTMAGGALAAVGIGGAAVTVLQGMIEA